MRAHCDRFTDVRVGTLDLDLTGNRGARLDHCQLATHLVGKVSGRIVGKIATQDGHSGVYRGHVLRPIVFAQRDFHARDPGGNHWTFGTYIPAQAAAASPDSA